MKYFNIKMLSIAVTFLFLIVSCSKEGEYTLTETPPLDFTTSYNGLTVTFTNATDGASDISWDFGDGSSVVTGESVEYTYATIGNYVITMNGKVNGKEYSMHTVLRVDKASVVNLEDDSFSDWDDVTYPDFILEGQEHMLGGKVDYDANYVYFFIEWETTGTNGLATLETAIMDLYMDVDNSTATGFSSSIGAELLYEGNIPTEWFDYYRFTGAEQGDWSWDYFSLDNAIILGHTETAGEVERMEFAVSRDALGINKDAFAFRLELYYSDWSAMAANLSKDNESRIVMMMNKQ
ncbi:MAG: PKD domain-containing protein [Bacteroidales bacterium]